MESEITKARIDAIDGELKAMGGAAIFGGLPDGCIPVSVFMKRYGEIKTVMEAFERDKLRVDHEREILLKQKEYAFPSDVHRIDQQLQCNAQKLSQYYADSNAYKNSFTHFLQNNRPFDADRFLAKKHDLLNERLKLLEELRLWEASQPSV